MAHKLLAEILNNRPPAPGPQWWLLLALAEDASDRTRRTACGYDYMAQRTKASRPTIYRWLKRLHDDGLIITVTHSQSGGRGGAKGTRAVYEIQVPGETRARITAHLTVVEAA